MLEIRNFTTNEIDERFFKKTAATIFHIIEKEKVFSELSKKSKIEISLAIIGDARMRRLNKIYRGKNRVTDVLSFGDKSVLNYLININAPKQKRLPKQEFVEAPDGISRLGEIIICYSRAKKQAQQVKHSFKKEIAFLLVHGVLHLLGYEHEKGGAKEQKMKEMEKKILEQLFIN